jgi:hypothetical protein
MDDDTSLVCLSANSSMNFYDLLFLLTQSRPEIASKDVKFTEMDRSDIDMYSLVQDSKEMQDVQEGQNAKEKHFLLAALLPTEGHQPTFNIRVCCCNCAKCSTI